MSRAPMRAILILAVVLGAACANNDIVPIEQDAEFRQIRNAAPEPLGLRLAIAPIIVDFDPDAVNRRAESDYRYSAPMDWDGLRAEFANVVREYGTFGEVGLVEGEDLDACIDKAFEDEYDLVLELRMSKFDVHYEGVTGWYAPNLLNFAMFIWTAWWVTDEIYGGNIEMEANLYSAHSGQAVYLPEIYKHTELRELDDFERGWKLTGSIFIPSGLEPDNWQQIHDVVMPHAVRKIQGQLVSDLNSEFHQKASVADGEFADQMAKTLAVIVGVTRHEAFLIHNLRYAADDSTAFNAFLTDPNRGAVPPKNVKLFENHTATLENVKGALTGFVNTYCRENDTVIFYFAGYGALTDAKGAGGDGHRKYLMMADTDVDNLSETAFSLTELDEICDALPAKNVILMFDASFNQGGETRTYIDVRQPPAEVTLDDAYLTQLSDNPGHIVVAACQPNEGALMLDEEQRGLFTHYFLQAVETEVTGSDDQIVTLAEVFQAALPNAQDRADIEGVTQTPTVYGTGAGDVALVYLGGTRAAPEDDEGGSEEPPVEDGGEEEGAPGGGE